MLLTLSLLLPAIALIGTLSPVEAPLHLNPGWRVGLITMGVVCGVLATMNMLAVRRELASKLGSPPN